MNQFIMNLSGKEYENFYKINRWREKFELNHREALYVVELVYWTYNNEN